MFYDTEMKIVTEQFQAVKTIQVDLQPYDKIISFEDGIELDITKRVFCDTDLAISIDSYVYIQDILYKVMKMKVWSDYMELWLYQCNR